MKYARNRSTHPLQTFPRHSELLSWRVAAMTMAATLLALVKVLQQLMNASMLVRKVQELVV